MVWLNKKWIVSFWKKDKNGNDILDFISGSIQYCEKFIESTLIENEEYPENENNLQLIDTIPQPDFNSNCST